MGSAYFITTVVMFLTVRAAENQEIQLTKQFFLRDLVFLLIDFMISVGFILIYLVFVVIVVIQSKRQAKA